MPRPSSRGSAKRAYRGRRCSGRSPPAEPAAPILGGTYDILANIDDAGNLVAGLIAIEGTVPSLGFNSDVLLTGVLTDFGFRPAGGDPLEFLFEVNGGDAAALYGGVGALAGTKLTNVGAGFPGNFLNDFEGSGFSTSNTAPVPEPSGLVCVMLAGLGLLSLFRKW